MERDGYANEVVKVHRIGPVRSCAGGQRASLRRAESLNELATIENEVDLYYVSPPYVNKHITFDDADVLPHPFSLIVSHHYSLAGTVLTHDCIMLHVGDAMV